jgi:hypothetical protein
MSKIDKFEELTDLHNFRENLLKKMEEDPKHRFSNDIYKLIKKKIQTKEVDRELD